jgi:phage baseplate assembly protein W
MSQDIRLTWRCPHQVLEEVVTLGDDRRSLPTRSPVAATGSVRVTVNDELVIPPEGLFTAAQISSTDSGPFDVPEGGDVLEVVTISGTVTHSFGVVNRARLTTDQIVRQLILAGFQEAVRVDNINGHLVFTDLVASGPGSFVKVRGSAAVFLGFGGDTRDSVLCGIAINPTRQRTAHGRQLYPGWEIYVPDPTAYQVQRYPRFRGRLRTNPVIKVSYVTELRQCPRCGGKYLENDYRFNETGDVLLVIDEDLLHQAALKIVLTERGSNPYHTYYGTKLHEKVGAKAIAGVATLINEDVRRALSRFQALQQEQAKYQAVTPKERIYRVLSVRTFSIEEDPTAFVVEVVIQNASAAPIVLTVPSATPDVIAFIQTSNGLISPNAGQVGL